ncbi:MAG: DUF1570 domain-containing protein [Planctomycetota bacterium]
MVIDLISSSRQAAIHRALLTLGWAPLACGWTPLACGWVLLAVTWVLVTLGGLTAPQLLAESPTAIPPRFFGLDIPAGKLEDGQGRRVELTWDERQVVGRIHVEVGEHHVILLPDGRLIAQPSALSVFTDKPFQPQPKDKVATYWVDHRLAGFQTRTSRHYVFVYNTSEEFTAVTTRVLESMVPGLLGFAEMMKIPAREPELPLVVVMFRTGQQMQAFQKVGPGVIAYYSPLDNYIVLCEQPDTKPLPAVTALQLSLSTIAHEGAHQILANIGVHQRLAVWPMWLSEGLAEYLAPTIPGKQGRWKGAGQPHDLRLLELDHYLKSRENQQLDGQLIEQTILAARLTSTGYASAWALTHHLAKNQRSEFQRMLSDAARLGPLEGDLQTLPPGIIPGNLERFRATLPTSSEQLEKRLILHLKKLVK